MKKKVSAYPSYYSRFYGIIRRIPRGRVATYGQIARAAGLPGHSRQVGIALAALRDNRVPWQRVINSRGEISPRAVPYEAERQRSVLETEGIQFNSQNRVPLDRYQWNRRASKLRPG